MNYKADPIANQTLFSVEFKYKGCTELKDYKMDKIGRAASRARVDRLVTNSVLAVAINKICI